MKESYSAADIEVLPRHQAIRKRAGMYIGSTDRDGVRHLVWIALERVIDDHLRRMATELHVAVDGGWIAIRDDGPGIPVDLIERRGKRWSALEVERLGLHGVGPSIVIALGARLEVETTRDGVRWGQVYERGEPVTPLRSLGPTSLAGTLIRFRPDPAIFTCEVAADDVRDDLQRLAWLQPLLRVTFQERRLPGIGGPPALVRSLATAPIRASADFEYRVADIAVDVALAWCDNDATDVRAFANLRATPHGDHVAGFWQGLAAWAEHLGAPRGRLTAARKVLGRGLVAVLHVRMADPRFTSQARTHLAAPEAAAAVREAFVRDAAHRFRWQRGSLQDFLRDRIGIAYRTA